MRIIFLFFLFFISCEPKPSNEIDALAEEVIKKGTGVEITVQPVPVKKD